jgi:hypothetical protein
MRIKSVTPTMLAPELEDITHACEQCGSELVRTVKPGASRAHPPDATRRRSTRAA